MRRITLFFLFLASIVSCQKSADPIANMDGLIGNWINPDYIDNTITFTRSGLTNIETYRLSILENGRVIERKNSGDCGTPPIFYADFEGTWSQNDSIIAINVLFWGGDAVYQWKVVSVDNSKLKVIILNQSYNSISK